MIELALKFWCRHFHKKVLRPVHGKYACVTCLRLWPVPWEDRQGTQVAPCGNYIPGASSRASSESPAMGND